MSEQLVTTWSEKEEREWHWSDCPTGNAPALPVGDCTCNGRVIEEIEGEEGD